MHLAALPFVNGLSFFSLSSLFTLEALDLEQTPFLNLASSSKSSTKDFVTTLPLQQDPLDSTYYTTVSIGTPPQEFQLGISLASSNPWVIDSECDSETCRTLASYDSSSSDTYSPTDLFLILDSTLALDGTAYKVFGNEAIDTMQVGNITIDHQAFVQVNDEGGMLDGRRISGVFGLGLASLSAEGMATPLIQITEEYNLTELAFSISLTNETITFGGNETLHIKGIEWTTVDYAPYWQTTLSGLNITYGNITHGNNTYGNSTYGNNTDIVKPFDLIPLDGVVAAPDPNTEGIVLPTNVANELNTKLGFRSVSDEFSAPCDEAFNFPNVTINLGSGNTTPKSHVLTPAEYVKRGESDCTSLFYGRDLPRLEVGDDEESEGLQLVILGKPFLHRYDAYFSKRGNETWIGFSNAVPSNYSTTHAF